jgi:hypothetical protein
MIITYPAFLLTQRAKGMGGFGICLIPAVVPHKLTLLHLSTETQLLWSCGGSPLNKIMICL